MKKKVETYEEFKKRVLHDVESLFPLLFVDPITCRIAYWIHKKKLNIHPNHITMLRLFLLFPLGLLLFLIIPLVQMRILYLIAAILFFIGIYTDSLDGQLARGTGKKSAKGAFLDSLADRFATVIFISLLFSIGLSTNNIILLYSSIVLFILKILHLTMVTMAYYHSKKEGIDSATFLDRAPAFQSMKVMFLLHIADKLKKRARFKRLYGGVGGYEVYIVTIIIPALLMFFGLDIFASLLGYALSAFFILFYLTHIRRMLVHFGE